MLAVIFQKEQRVFENCLLKENLLKHLENGVLPGNGAKK